MRKKKYTKIASHQYFFVNTNQLIHLNKLSCRQVSFSHLKWTSSREEYQIISVSSVHLNRLVSKKGKTL